jgi:SPP1 gp7 family putative phage head morphogenesis protein
LGRYFSPELVRETGNQLTEAVMKGYGADWTTPDHLMLEKLVENVFAFSGAKDWHQLNDITQALRDESGRLREFNEFKEAAQNIGHKYNADWLYTEYDTAVSSATSAARWTEYNSERDIFPMLQYETAGDDKVRSEHRLLDGTRKPIGDVFWKTYYPPNGWNCRCTVLQVPESNAREAEPKGLPHVPEMFRTNLAENGLIFPKNHPYYTGVPKDVLRRSMQYIPPEYAFRNMGVYEEHAMLQYEPEAPENREIATMLYESGERNIRLMPRLQEHEIEFREKIYGKEYNDTHPRKCPDSFIDSEAAEFKRCKNSQRKKRLQQAAEQADNVVLEITDSLSKENIDNFVKHKWNSDKCANLKRIIIINNGVIYKYGRP